jgi:branched-chain amino acid transport system substrate-binding protein
MWKLSKKKFGVGALAAVMAIPLLSASFAVAQETVKIGMLTDMNSAYADLQGKTGVVAVEMAIEDFGGSVLGRKIELLVADHQLKPAVASAIATEWFDSKDVDVITGLIGSSVSLAAQEIVRDRPSKLIMHTMSVSSDISGKYCAANAIHWAIDAFPLAVTTMKYLVGTAGAKKIFVMLPDSAAGAPYLAAATRGITDAGGEVVGSIRVPPASGDVSSYVLQAQGSGADNIALGFGGNDAVNVVRAANQFGVVGGGTTISSLGLYATDVTALGLDLAQGMIFATPFYSGASPEAKSWAERFEARTGTVPAFSHVNDYEATLHYLKAVEAAGTTEASAVVAKMRELPVVTFATEHAHIREDNHVVRDVYVGKVKSPEASTSAGDYMEYLSTIPADEAYLPLAESECTLVNQK